MIENSVQSDPVKPSGRAGRAVRVLLLLGLVAAALLFALPHLWLRWRQLPARSLVPGATEAEVTDALGPADVRLPLDSSDPLSGGLSECWVWFWPEDPLRKVCKRLPFAPDSSAFDLEERSDAMVRAYFDRARVLQTIELE